MNVMTAIQRDDLVVRDSHGVFHVSVLCNSTGHIGEGSSEGIVRMAVITASPDDPPFLCTMCDYFECIDKAAQHDPASFGYPRRRWTLDQEIPGVVTCIFCLGV